MMLQAPLHSPQLPQTLSRLSRLNDCEQKSTFSVLCLVFIELTLVFHYGA